MMTYITNWEQEKDAFNFAKMKEKKNRDLDHVRCLKSYDQKGFIEGQ